jgi:excisionase family DNA binding protein
VTPEQLAEHLGVDIPTVRKWIDCGKLPAFQFGARQTRIKLSEAVVFVEKQRLRPAPSARAVNSRVR